jgi:hypothetical protein
VRSRNFKSLSEENVAWIEFHCRTPFGPERGQRVRLSDQEKLTVRRIYDRQDLDSPSIPITDNLAAFLALLHLCGPMALSNDHPLPPVEADPWSSLALRRCHSASVVEARRRCGHLS